MSLEPQESGVRVDARHATAGAEPFRPAATIIFFALLAIVHTWPLATDPGHLSRNDNADAQLNEWIISWVAHRLPTDPQHLFDANIFHPERYTLAFSEPLIVPGVLAMPLRWAGASPVLTYNLVLLLGLVLCGVAMAGVITAWTGDRWAGLLAGSLFAFNSQTMTRLPHLQAIHAEWLPLAIWALDRLLIGDRHRDAYWLALFVTLICLTSGYLGIFTVFALAAAFLIRWPEWQGPRMRRTLPRVALAAALTTVIVVPVLWPYAIVHRTQGLTRQLKTVESYSVSPMNYLVSVSNLHFDFWSRSVRRTITGTKTSLFPGAVALLMAACAVMLIRVSEDRRRVRMFVAIAVTGFVLSMGTRTPVYELAYRLFPPLEGIRAVGRWGSLVLFSMAALAGLGLAEVRRRVGTSVWALVVPLGAVFVANVESLYAPVKYTRFERIPALYRILADDPVPGAVVELPLYGRRAIFRNAPYVLASTEHWRPLVNGYSGFRPPSYLKIVQAMAEFPSASAVGALQARNVRYVVLHTDLLPEKYVADILQTFQASPYLHQVASAQNLRLYLLVPSAMASGGPSD